MNILEEKHKSNFGHEIMYKTNFNLKKNQVDKNNFVYNQYKKGNVKLEKNQNNYFELTRYNILINDIDTNVNKPIEGDDPFLIISTFMKSENIYNNNYENFFNKYFQHQIKLILCYKYYVKGKIRLYIDNILLNNLKNVNDSNKYIFSNIFNNEFNYYDIEEENNEKLNLILNSFKNYMQKYDNHIFDSLMHRILFYYEVASRYDLNLLNNIDEKVMDIFGYELKNDYQEYIKKEVKIGKLGIKQYVYVASKEKTEYKYHKNEGYIGQMLRFISMKQQDYEYNDIMIKRPKHLVFRDGHSNSIGFNDSKWILELNRIMKNLKKSIFLIPSSIEYDRFWHDMVKSDVTHKYIRKSAIAGIIQMANFEDTLNFIPEEIYVQSIGMPFLINQSNFPILLNERYIFNDEKILLKCTTEFEYGIDEYVLSSLFLIDYYKERNIYFRHYLLDNYFNLTNISRYDTNNFKIYLASCVLLYYLYEKNIFNKINIYDKFEYIIEIEKLRKNNIDPSIKLFLDIFPNKYHIDRTIFSFFKNDLVRSTRCITYNNVKLLLSNLQNNDSNTNNISDSDINNFYKELILRPYEYGIYEYTKYIHSPFYWDVNQNEKKNKRIII